MQSIQGQVTGSMIISDYYLYFTSFWEQVCIWCVHGTWYANKPPKQTASHKTQTGTGLGTLYIMTGKNTKSNQNKTSKTEDIML